MAMESPEERGGLFAARNFIVGRLKETGWAHEQVMSPSQLGVHPCNRGNYGCNEEYVHQLAADIFEVGWDASKVAGALCVEDNNQRTIELHNINLTKASEFLAPVEPRSIAAGTLTNGHTVLLLRALVHGVKCNQPSISVDGIMSMAKVEHVRPLMAQAAKQGWVWTVLSKDCAAVYGNRLFEFLSGAHNVQLSRVEHELEVLLKMFRHASDCEKKSELIDWSQIMKMILRTKPECSDYISSMIKFLKEFGGGSGAPFVDELIRFHRKHVPGHRLVGGSFWEHLASLNFVSKAENINTPGVLMRYAILKAEYRCPADKVVNRVCKFISKSDLDTLAKKYVKAVCAAEALLSECRRIVLAHGGDVSGDTLSKQFGLLDIAVVRLLLNKQQSSPIKFASIEAVACYFIAVEHVLVAGHAVDRQPLGRLSHKHFIVFAGRHQCFDFHEDLGFEGQCRACRPAADPAIERVRCWHGCYAKGCKSQGCPHHGLYMPSFGRWCRAGWAKWQDRSADA